jgi:hypothetical protein
MLNDLGFCNKAENLYHALKIIGTAAAGARLAGLLVLRISQVLEIP